MLRKPFDLAPYRIYKSYYIYADIRETKRKETAMMFNNDYNLEAAAAYHAHLAHSEHEYAELLKVFPPACDECKQALITPDEKWAWCPGCEEWVGGNFDCIAPDDFEPKRTWEEQAEEWAYDHWVYEHGGCDPSWRLRW